VAPGARHGLAAPRGLTPVPGTGGGRFGRLFPALPRRDAGPRAIAALADAMATLRDVSDNKRVPSGYTYLGQFVDHDITFDPASRLRRDNDPSALVDFRTPRLDLDSLYGAGAADQPYLYDWDEPRPGVRLLVGGGAGDPVDLPRNHQGRALTGDARNDEHQIISQLQLLFVRFHNQVVAWLAVEHERVADNELLEEAQRLVRWHYQWIVLHDYLPKVLGGPSPPPARRFFTWRDEPFIPVEFSAAAFRFGHSMVRGGYQLGDVPGTLPILADPRNPVDDGRHLGGFGPLAADRVIDWSRFFFDAQASPDRGEHSMRIDPRLVKALHHLPPDDASLPLLNLRRGRALGLPAGPDVAHAMGLPGLDDATFRSQLPRALWDTPAGDALVRAPPLWYYILAEANVECAGLHLGPVGRGIVGEVLLGLLEGDPHSYLSQWPTWRPTLPGAPETAPGDFAMTDLIAFTERGEAAPPP
jgi:hypothetical protein